MQTQTNRDAGSISNIIHRGPPLGRVAIVYTLLFVSSLVIVNAMTAGAAFPKPTDSLESIRDYYLHYANAIRVAAFLQFGSAIPLGIFTASTVSRLRFHKINVPGVDI